MKEEKHHDLCKKLIDNLEQYCQQINDYTKKRMKLVKQYFHNKCHQEMMIRRNKFTGDEKNE